MIALFAFNCSLPAWTNMKPKNTSYHFETKGHIWQSLICKGWMSAWNGIPSWQWILLHARETRLAQFVTSNTHVIRNWIPRKIYKDILMRLCCLYLTKLTGCTYETKQNKTTVMFLALTFIRYFCFCFCFLCVDVCECGVGVFYLFIFFFLLSFDFVY